MSTIDDEESAEDLRQAYALLFAKNARLRAAQPGAVSAELLSSMDMAVLRMPFDLAMGGDASRFQFYGRVQSLIDRIEAIVDGAATHPNGAPMYSTTTFKENGQPIMLNADGTRSIFCDVDDDIVEPPVTDAEVRVCECDLRTRLVGDGCSVCNPEKASQP